MSFLLAFFFLQEVKAQEMEVTCQLKIHNKYDGKDTTEVAWCQVFSSVGKANEIVKTIQQNQSSMTSLDYDPEKAKRLTKLVKDAFKRKKSRKTGEVTYPTVIPGMAVVFLTTDFDAYKVFTIKEGQTYYSDTVNVMRIPETIHTKDRARKKYDEVSTIDYGDGYERFKISAYLPEGLAKDDSRLIFQVCAVDCQTEDTVAYLYPKVFEGADYHEKQVKRKGYDFFKNDPLAVGYDSSDTLSGGKEKNISTVILFKKPDKSRHYRGPFTYSIEDFHHSYYRKDNPGTCLRKQPFKFLDFSVAEASLDLDRESFYEEPDMGVDSVMQDLALEFQVGKAELKEDSTYGQKLADLAYELSQVDDLLSAELVAYVSPEGGMAINGPLVQRRADKAASLIHMPHGKRPTTRSHVYTWEETAAELEKLGETAAAQALLDTLALAGKDWRSQDRMIRNMSIYESIILPEMERERKMTFTYRSLREHVKTPTEAFDAYLANRNKPLSWGDYYNVFETLIDKYRDQNSMEDSVELETLTRVTYQRLMKMSEPMMIKIAPYLINQMAVVQNRVAPDTTILKPLLNDTLPVNTVLTLDFNTQTKLTINRPEFILNQAVAFFKLQEVLRAKQMLQMIKQDIGTYSDDVREAVQKLQYFIDFKEQLPNTNRTDEQEKLFRAALAFIESSGADNRAVLYTELPDEIYEKASEAEYWVNLMSDEKPQKWYLKGILWAKKTNAQAELNLDDLPDGGGNLPDVGEDIDINRMGHYLGYFQHAFDLDKSAKHEMMRYYFNEGHVEEEVRKLYPYKQKMVPYYRKIFELRKQIDDDELSDAVDELEKKGYDLEEMGYGALLQTLHSQTESDASSVKTPAPEQLQPASAVPSPDTHQPSSVNEPKAE